MFGFPTQQTLRAAGPKPNDTFSAFSAAGAVRDGGPTGREMAARGRGNAQAGAAPDLAPRPRQQAIWFGPYGTTLNAPSAWRGQSPASVRQLPHLHGVVRTPRGQPLAVRAEGHAVDRVGISLESQDLLT